MTAQVLGKELETIIQESKRKHNELKNGADKSLRDLRALPSTSETQLAADLRRRPLFSSPFITACKTGSSKLILPAIVCLQRLVVSGGLASERLQEVLDAFLECSKSSLDVQLRVLQALPSLLQNYSNGLEGDLQSTILQVCTTLQQVKNVSVSSTASATLQQVVSSVFEKVEDEDGKIRSVPVSTELNIGGKKVPVRSAAHDAYRVLEDLCLVTEGQPAQFVKGASLTQPFGLELIEAILTNHGEIFDSHEEFGFLLRSRVMSLVTRFLSERLNFAVTVRVTRVLCIVIREHLNVVQSECEIPLSLLNHLLDSDGFGNSWRRALCMETFRVIYSTPNLATDVYHLFDENPNRRNLIQENLAHFVRLAAEKPALIGVGQQSSFPTGPGAARGTSQDQVMIETGSVAGIISGDLGVSEVSAPGISTQWSSLKTPCLDVLDKADPPSIPETYVYSLVLSCLNNLSESLAKVILPLTILGRDKLESQLDESTDGGEDVSVQRPSTEDRRHNEQNGATNSEKPRGQSLPLNPLTLEKHKNHPYVKSIAKMVDECWPAVLATSSTFLYAALDADFYRGLIRSVQKFTQVAGLLRLATPRDAFFTTLAKSAIPPNAFKMDGPFSPTGVTSPRIGSGSEGFFAESPTTKSHQRRGSLDATSPVLSQRNLMCLRALINLAIALGPTLDKSWSIIVESLQKADTILAQSETSTAREYRASSYSAERQSNDPNSSQLGLNAEISAVEAAVARLLQATADFPNSAFMHVLRAFCDVAGNTKDFGGAASPIPGGSLRLPRKLQNTTTLTNTAPNQTRSVHFAISKLGDLARININRLAIDAENGGWELLSNKLRSVSASPFIDSTARLMAADVIGSVALGITLDTVEENAKVREEVQLRSLASLELGVQALYENIQMAHEIAGAADHDIHRAALEALRAILEKCGESLIAGWRSIFSILRSTFDSAVGDATEEDDIETKIATRSQKSPHPISPKIGRPAFACVQLICSDFLESLKRSRIIILIDILCQFCAQSGDLNISLTTVTLFWNLSDFLQDQLEKESDPNSRVETVNKDSDKEALRKAAEEGSTEAMWMILQSQLASMTKDERVDVRNGAVQTVFRILSNRGDRLSAKLWVFTFHRVIFQMMEINIQRYRLQSQPGVASEEESKSLESTTDMILKGFSGAISTHLDIVTALSGFQGIWQALLDQFSSFLDLGSDEICASIFDFFTQILGAAETVEAFGLAAIQNALVLLLESTPTPKDDSTRDAPSREKALESYVQTLKQIYSLVQDRVEPSQVKRIAVNLQRCLLVSTSQAYTSDVDSLTNLQLGVLNCFEMLRTDLPEVPSAIVERLSELSAMPYNNLNQGSVTRGPTFVALSKRSMELLQKVILTHHSTREIYDTGALNSALKALSLAMRFKYTHEKQGRSPSMWQKATTSALEILPKILPELHDSQNRESIHSEIWNTIGEMKGYITIAPDFLLPGNDSLLIDELFDLEASETLRRCFGINVDQNKDRAVSMLNDIPQRRHIAMLYVWALFQSSLIHETGLPMTPEPLRNLYTIKPGSTIDRPFNRRIRMCYQSLDEIFALATAGLNDRVVRVLGEAKRSEDVDGRQGDADAALPTAAFGYLVLRCALPLKRYISDQALRGKMPTPTSQRLELLYVLKKMRDLNCVAGKDMDGDRGHKVFKVPMLKPWKRHLEWLLPLVNMASMHARRDVEIADAMYEVMDEAFAASQP